ncbi:MAG: DUF3800 domain-containing protein [Gammaproteobacteria bacterium]|nr:DUF3800 domain-containing protein [Gammaproteobacteria bacterium]
MFNIYCDESCHLEHDRQKVMVLGAVWAPMETIKQVSTRISEIKQEHGLHPHAEIKWTKVSPSKQQLYLDLVNYFFDVDSLRFRGLVAPKNGLGDYNQSHDQWYYKMYFDMLKLIFSPTGQHSVYLDIKDSRGGRKVKKLHDALCNNMYDFKQEIIQKVQIIRSEESQLMQLTDLLIGVVSYANRELSGSSAKMALVDKTRIRTGYTLTKSTLCREEKFNMVRIR